MTANGWVAAFRGACRRVTSRHHGPDDERSPVQGLQPHGLQPQALQPQALQPQALQPQALQQDRAAVLSWLDDVEELAGKACDLPRPELKGLAASLHAQAGSIREQLHLS